MTGIDGPATSLRLYTLGTIAVRDWAGADLPAVVARSKEVALLVYLAMGGRRGAVRRDTLLALFWPELDTARARAALSQAVYRLRRSIGDEAIASVGRDDVMLGRECWCDAAAFLDQIERDERARAMELYAGEFLPGFHLPGAPDFDDWAQEQRDRLRDLAGETAEGLARQAEASGELGDAARWWRRKVVITPTDEAALRSLVETLDRVGDRAGAVRVYDEFVRQLARTLELEPAPETRALLDAVRARGTPVETDTETARAPGSGGLAVRPEGATGVGSGELAPGLVESTATGPLGRRREPTRLRLSRAAVAGGLLAVAAVAATGWLLAGRAGLPQGSGLVEDGSRIVVADVVSDTGQADLGLAVREALVTDLDHSGHVRVVERAQLDGVLARMRRSDTASITDGVALEIARREGHAAVLSLAVGRLGAGYQVSARILDVASGEAVVRVRETAVGDEQLITAVERLSRHLRRRLGESLRHVRASPPLPDVTTSSLEALALLARAQAFARRAEWRRAIRLAEQAVELDTAFAAAHTALASWYGNVADPTLAEQYAERAYRHAGRLPAKERLWATARYHARHGRLDSTVHYHQLIVDLDPGNSLGLVGLGNALDGMGRVEEALVSYRRALQEAPDVVTAYNKVMVTLRRLGREREADSVLNLMRQRFPEAPVTWIGEVAQAMLAADFDRADSLAAMMTSHGNGEIRFWGKLLGAILSSLHGRLRGATRDAEALSAEALQFYGPQATAAFLRLTVYAARAAHTPERALPAVERAERRLTGSSRSLDGLRGLAVVATGYTLAGRVADARRVLAQMDSLAAAADLRTGVADEVRAVIALRDGRPGEAVSGLARAREANFGTLSLMGQFALADAYTALRRHGAAAATYDSVLYAVPTYDYETFYLGPMWPLTHERLGRVYEALGDTQTAIRHLTAFTELWREADPDLVPRVEAARRAIRRLRSGGGG